MENDDEYLQHYGVKGMQWGVRRSAKQLAKASKDYTKRKSVKSEDKQMHDANRKKGTKALSDKELQKLVNRMNMEQNYSRMNSSSLKKGNATVLTILAVGATANQAMAFAKSPAGKALGEWISKKSKIVPRGAIGA